jgi:hypothetical protein
MSQRHVRRRKASPLASWTVGEHLARGVAGLIAAAIAIAALRTAGPLSLVLLPIAVVAWRGCPTCWTVGLIGTLSDDRARRTCLSRNCSAAEAGAGHRRDHG